MRLYAALPGHRDKGFLWRQRPVIMRSLPASVASHIGIVFSVAPALPRNENFLQQPISAI